MKHSCTDAARPQTLFRQQALCTLAAVLAVGATGSALAMSLMAKPDATASGACAKAYDQQREQLAQQQQRAPAAAAQRLAGSLVAQGQRDVAWAWLGSPTVRYPHASMGSREHAGSLHVITRQGRRLQLELPLHRVFEDLQPRVQDIDGDGHEEVLLIEAHVTRGAALVAYSLNAQATQLREVARSPDVGSPWRWLNPIGVADFDGDGKLDIASITTPHVGGVLHLYRYRASQIQSFAQITDVSNHRMGDPNLQLHAILQEPGKRPTIVVPDMSHRALHALRWEGSKPGEGAWKELADVKPMPGRITYLMPDPQQATGACAQLDNGQWWRIDLIH
jgi:hypothetical protein